MNDRQEELTLRDLYLIFKRGLGWILGVSLLAAAATFAIKIAQPHEYRTSANVQVSPLQLTKQAGSAIDLTSVTQVDFETFRTIATSQPVLAAALKAVPSAPSSLTPQTLADKVSVREVGKGAPLVVNLSVVLPERKVAAELVNAWAKSSADAVRAAVTTSVEDVTSRLSSQQAALLTALNQAEAKWTAFQKIDERAALQAQLSALDDQTTSAQQSVLSLDRSIASTRAQQKMLEGIVKARTQGSAADVQAQLRALAENGVLSQTESDALAGAVSSLPGGSGLANQDLATLVARSQLQQSASDLAGYVAERQVVQTQLQTFTKQEADLRAQLADQTQKATVLQRDLSQATSAYDDIAQVAPTADAIAKLVPAMVSVLNTATVPIQPQRRHTLVTTAVALVLAFFAMVLFVFLRAAVRPDAQADGTGAPSAGERPRGGPAADAGSPREPSSGNAPPGASDSTTR